jgi:hypothetical protein
VDQWRGVGGLCFISFGAGMMGWSEGGEKKPEKRGEKMGTAENGEQQQQ